MFSQTEILLMIFVVSVLLIFIVVLTILDILEYRKSKIVEENYLEEDNREFVPQREEVTIMEIEEEKVLEPVNTVEVKNNDEPLFEEIGEEDYIPSNNSINDESVFVKEETVASEITYNDFKEDMPKRVNLNEELTKIENTMVDENEIEKKVLSFEEEQERTAIISLDELLQKTDDLYNENEVVQYDDGNEPISIDEVINMYNKEQKEINVPEIEAIVEEKVEEKKELYSKKEDIPFISSVYGIEKNEMSFENTATYEKLDREKSNEFMRELKERIENQ